ncbi:MAG: flagellar protein FliS [Planctomycetaceae bacterium]
MTSPSQYLKDAVQDQTSWTDQLKLLNRVYQAALKEIRLGAELLAANKEVEAAKPILRAQRLILEIVAGLDPSFGDVPEQVEQLCYFCLQCLGERTVEDLQAADHILTILAEGFSEIVGEISNLEATGQLPQREAERSLVNHVV